MNISEDTEIGIRETASLLRESIENGSAYSAKSQAAILGFLLKHQKSGALTAQENMAFFKRSLNKFQGRSRNLVLDAIIRSHDAPDVPVGCSEIVNVFWCKLMVAWNAGVFGRGEAAKQYFKAVSDPALDGHPPGAVNQGPGFSPERVTLKAWKSYKLFFDPEGVISKMQEHLRKQNDVLPIGQRDLQAQLSKEQYWVKPGNKEGRHKQRLGAGKVPRTVWCFDLDRHKEFGYQPVLDEELLKSRDDVGASEWQDPRLGELYQIAFEVESDRSKGVQ